MYQTDKRYITQETKIAELIFNNPSFLLFLEHFNFEFVVREKTIAQLCIENSISPDVFISFANMANGFAPNRPENFTVNDINVILMFLKNSHNYFENEKYPEIRSYIEQLDKTNALPEIKLVGKFFDEYFEEVKEHFEYENSTVFPYFAELTNNLHNGNERDFKLKNYSEHHTDIEFKLNDLRELLLKHIPVQGDRVLRRKIIISLFELEHYLNIHSAIEETILMPLIDKLEKSYNGR